VLRWRQPQPHRHSANTRSRFTVSSARNSSWMKCRKEAAPTPPSPLNTKAPVIERFGLQGYGAHSADAEYVLLDSIEPRLYLLSRMIMDVSQGKSPPAQ